MIGLDAQHTVLPSDLGPDPAVAASAALASGSKTSDGIGFGMSFGYDLLVSPGWVVGIEADGSVDSWQDNRRVREWGVDYLATVRGRIGTYVRPDVLLYGTVGVAFLGIEYKRTDDFVLGDVSGGIPLSVSRTVIGPVAGGGIEYDWSHMTLFAEYLFASYNSVSFTDPITTNFNLGTTTVERVKGDFDEHLLRLGVKFKIGYDFLEGPLGW